MVHPTLRPLIIGGLLTVAVGACTPRAKHAPRERARVTPALLAQLEHTDWRERVKAAQVLGTIRSDAAAEALREAAKDTDPRVRLEIFRACGAHGSPKLVAPLKKGLAEKSRRLRLAAVRALGRVGTAPAAEALVETLDGASMWLRPAVADALAAMPPRALSGVEATYGIFLAEADPAQRGRFLRLARAMVSIGAPALARLVAAINNPGKDKAGKPRGTDRQCRLKPCQILLAAGKPALGGLVALCRDGAQNLSAHTVCRSVLPIVFSRLGEVVLPFVVKHHGAKTKLGTLAYTTLKSMGPGGAKAVFARLKKPGQSAAARRRLLKIIGRMRYARAFKILSVQARAGAKPLRLAAIAGLGYLGSAPARKLLTALQKAPDAAIAKAAKAALSTSFVAPGFEGIGIPECDVYFAAMRCYLGTLPAAARGPAEAAFQKSLEAWKKMAHGPARASLAKTCKMTMEAWRKAVAKIPQYSRCLGP